jgi:hypothetical protein
MINQIGESAGVVWRYLNEHSTGTAAQINESTKLDGALLYMAIGWLAREGKLLFSGEGKEATLSLRAE